jgi:hypothetical protein
MSVMVVMPGFETFMGGWYYERLVEWAIQDLSDPDDRLALRVGGYQNALFLDSMLPSKARRLADALAPASLALADELRARAEVVPRDLEEAELLERPGTVLFEAYIAHDPRGRLLWLSRRLGLQNESQDWGIINADPDRLDEFVRFLDGTELRPAEVHQMVELILASANELLERDPGAPLDAVERVIHEHAFAGRFEIAYWRSLDDDQEFPIGAWLRART